MSDRGGRTGVPMRVCVVRQYYFPQDPRVRKEVSVLLERGHEVDVVCLRKEGEPREDTWRGARIHRLPMSHKRGGVLGYVWNYSVFLILAAFACLKLHARRRFHVVQVNTMPDILVFSALMPRLLGARVLLDMHEVMPELFMSIYAIPSRHPLVRLLKVLEWLSLKAANRVITVNEQCAAIFRSRGLAPGKLSIILNVPELPEEALAAAESDASLQNEEGEPFRLFSHGSILPRYGYAVLIRAMRLLLDQGRNVRLDIVGQGEQQSELEALCAELRLGDAVAFHGYQPFAELLKPMRAADLCVVALIKDVYTDIMLPNKLFEYVAMRKPVIASRTEAVLDFFGKDALAYYESESPEDMARTIAALMDDPERRAAMTGQAWQRMEPVMWERHKDEYLDIVESMHR